MTSSSLFISATPHESCRDVQRPAQQIEAQSSKAGERRTARSRLGASIPAPGSKKRHAIEPGSRCGRIHAPSAFILVFCAWLSHPKRLSSLDVQVRQVGRSTNRYRVGRANSNDLRMSVHVVVRGVRRLLRGLTAGADVRRDLYISRRAGARPPGRGVAPLRPPW